MPLGRASACADRRTRVPLAGRIPRRSAARRLLETRRAHARYPGHAAFSRRQRPGEPDAGERFRAECDVYARGHLRELPRSARHTEQRRLDQAGAHALPDLSRAAVAERSAYRHARAAHAPRQRIARQRLRQLPHAEDCRDARGRHGAQPHLQVHRARRSGTAEDAGRLHHVSHGQDAGVGNGGVENVAGVLAVAGRPAERRALGGRAVLLVALAAGQTAGAGWRRAPPRCERARRFASTGNSTSRRGAKPSHCPGSFSESRSEGGEPSEETEIRVVFTDTALYIGAVCHDRSPRAIVATQLSRDADLDVDDRLTIVLDPFFDHRNGFFFQVNAAGARADGQVSNNAESLSRDWDGIWNAVVRITDEGWIVEIEIPFKTLRFKPGQSTWGFNVERQIKRRQEIDRWTAARQNIWISNLAEAGRLDGLEGVRQGLGLDVRPYGSAAAVDGSGDAAGGVDLVQEPHTERQCRRHGEHGLCGDGSRSPPGQPHAISTVLPREASVLPRRRRRVRRRRADQHDRPAAVLQPPRRFDRRRRRARASWRQADRPAVRLQRRRARRGDRCADGSRLPGGSWIVRISWSPGSAAISFSSHGSAASSRTAIRAAPVATP